MSTQALAQTWKLGAKRFLPDLQWALAAELLQETGGASSTGLLSQGGDGYGGTECNALGRAAGLGAWLLHPGCEHSELVC